MSDNISADHINVSPHVTEVRFLDKWQPLLPILSALIAVLSFVGGIFVSMDAMKRTDAETRAAQWHEALQKINFDEASLVPTAFLIESFEGDDDSDRKSDALKIERALLGRTRDPDTFDLAVDDMFDNLKTPAEVNEAVTIGRRLDGRLHTIYNASIMYRPAGTGGFNDFLRNPQDYIDAGTERDQLDHAIILIWQLDTFSKRLACVWGGGSPEEPCRKFPPKSLDLTNLTLVNYAGPPHADKILNFEMVPACHVHHDEAQASYSCDDNPGDTL